MSQAAARVHDDQNLIGSPDGTRAFVGGKGEVWAIDLIAMRVYDTFEVVGGSANITSIAVSGDYLYIAEGDRYGSSPSRLFRMRIASGAGDAHEVIRIDTRNHDLASLAPNGFAGMGLNAAGTVLVLAAPRTPSLPRAETGSDERGDMIVIDLKHGLESKDGFLFLKGKGEGYVVASFGGTKGVSPYHVSAVSDNAFYVEKNGAKVGMTTQQALAKANEIRNDPSLLMTDYDLAARSAAHYFAYKIGGMPENGGATNYTSVDTINDRNPAPFQESPLDQYSARVSNKVVGSNNGSFGNRYSWWRNVVTLSTQGGNPYETLRTAVDKLGFTVTSDKSYEDKFGVMFHPLTPVIIPKTSNLLAQEIMTSVSLEEGWIMLPIDIAMESLVQVESVQIAKASQVESTYTICGMVNNRVELAVLPLTDILSRVPRSELPRTVPLELSRAVSEATKIVQQPKHGKIDSDFLFAYHPDEGFEGWDHFTLQTVYKGQRFTLHYRVLVAPNDVSYRGGRGDCAKPPFTTPELYINQTSHLQAREVAASAFSEGDFIMLPIDVAMDIPLPSMEVVQVANASQAKKPRDVTLCGVSLGGAGGQFSTYLLTDIIELLPKKDRPGTLSRELDDSVAAATRIIRQPKYGQLELESAFVTYRPDEGFEGEDRFTLRTVYKGQQFTLRYRVYVSLTEVLQSIHDCSDYPFVNSKISILPEEINPTNWYPTVSLQALLTGAKDALTGFSDLSGASLGQTTGNWITLDTNAAGHGWFIDYTPYLNEEWLPTSNPLEWVAKPGSEAEGKMDLLSVLLHEYGHTLGLDHSADTHDIMSTTLQPGMRRLPDAASWLALSNSQDGVAPVPETPTGPGAPVPVTMGLAAYLATRRRSGAQAALPQTQFETAANPALTNARFASGDGWATTGEVAFGKGAAKLKETGTAQTRLNQAFMLGQSGCRTGS